MNYSRVNQLGNPIKYLKKIIPNSSMMFGLIIVVALIFFELFNFSTTEYALKDLLGSLEFVGITWATILAIAFCAIDFAGIARLFTPEQGSAEPKEVWYLFGAWLLAASMNAGLTWWGVSMAIANHQPESTTIVSSSTIQSIIPIFVAVMVWLIRILILGTVSVAGDRLFWGKKSSTNNQPTRRPSMNPINRMDPYIPSQTSRSNVPISARAAYPRSNAEPISASAAEPTYHSVSMGASSSIHTVPGENSYNNSFR